MPEGISMTSWNVYADAYAYAYAYASVSGACLWLRRSLV